MILLFKKTVLVIVSLLFLCWLSAFLILEFESHEYYKVSSAEKAQAVEYLDGKVTPVPPEWQWQQFNPEPGITLRTGLLDANNAKGTIIFVPGWTGFAELDMHAVVGLNKAGYRVAYIEYRGQGKSTRLLSHPEKGHIESYAARAKDIAVFTETVRLKDKPLFFFAESMGAHITMRMAIEQAVDVSAYALVVPMIQMKAGPIPYAATKFVVDSLSTVGLKTMYLPGQSSWPDLPLVFGAEHHCNSNPQTAQRQSAFFALDETLRSKGATVGMVSKTAESSEKILSPGYMDALVQPVKMFTAGIDTLVDTDVSHQFCESLKNCEVTHYAQARHCISTENQQRMNDIVEQAAQFFDGYESRG